jgi:zinc finger SWIM domain-containing protein 3
MKTLKYGNKFYSGQSDVDKFLTLVKEYREKDKEMSFEYEYEGEDTSKLKRALLMSGKMKKVYKKFNDVIIVDAIYKTNKHDMPLVIFSGVTSDGSNIILAYAIIKKEDVETYQWIMHKLIEFTEGVEPGVIITDYDSALCHGIERSLNKSIHLLCQFHIRQ